MVMILGKIVAILLLVAADQGIKRWASAVLQPIKSIDVMPGIVELRFVLNDGMAFSLLSGKQTFLIIVTSIALLAVSYLLFTGKMFGKTGNAGLLLVLSGGIGNLIDRVLNGVVVDYINLQFINFAVFNFADICVTVGVGLLILDVLLDSMEAKKYGEV